MVLLLLFQSSFCGFICLGNIILLGVEISYALTAFHSDKEQKRHPILMLLDILELFYKKQQIGESVSEQELLGIIGRGELGRLPAYILQLEKQNLVKRTDNDEYVLARNLAQVDFWSFYSTPLSPAITS